MRLGASNVRFSSAAAQEEQRQAVVGVMKPADADALAHAGGTNGGGNGFNGAGDDGALVDVIRTGNPDLAAEAELCAAVCNSDE